MYIRSVRDLPDRMVWRKNNVCLCKRTNLWTVGMNFGIIPRWERWNIGNVVHFISVFVRWTSGCRTVFYWMRRVKVLPCGTGMWTVICIQTACLCTIRWRILCFICPIGIIKTVSWNLPHVFLAIIRIGPCFSIVGSWIWSLIGVDLTNSTLIAHLHYCMVRKVRINLLFAGIWFHRNFAAIIRTALISAVSGMRKCIWIVLRW